jgi:geranyl-CoA carboxylase alpha subunit
LPRLSVTTRFELDGQPVTADVEGSFADRCRVALEGGSSELSVQSVDGHRARVLSDGHREDIAFVQADAELLFLHAGRVHRVRDQRLAPLAGATAGKGGRMRASMTGRVVALHAKVGAQVEAGQPILTIEAMKIEHTQMAPIAGVLTHLHTELNQQVTAHRIVAEITPHPAGESDAADTSGGAGGKL